MTTPPKSSEIDMSPAAIERRLEQMRALYKLALYLKSAKPLGPVER